MIEIRSNFEPRSNEVWMRHIESESKFRLIQPMQLGV